MPSSIYRAWCNFQTHCLVWSLAFPLILSNISSSLVSTVDSYIVGHLPHVSQAGAVGIGSSFFNFLVGLFVFLRMSSAGLSAQAIGAEDSTTLRKVLSQGLQLSLFFTILLLLLGYPLVNTILDTIDLSAELKKLSLDFFCTRLLGLYGVLATYTLVGSMIGSGKAYSTLILLLASNIVNIVFNLWFVIGLDWGVVGSARASVIADWSAALLGFYFSRKSLLSFPGFLYCLNLGRWKNWSGIFSINRDIFLRTLILQIVFFLFSFESAKLGAATIAANTLLYSMLQLTANVLDGFAYTAESLCGRSIGAKDERSLGNFLVVILGWSLLISIIFSLGFFFLGNLFIQLQTNLTNVREEASSSIIYLSIFPLVAVWSYLLDGVFIGFMCTRQMRKAMATAGILMLPIGYLLQGTKNDGVWISLLLFMLLRGLIMGMYSLQLIDRKRSVF